MERYAGAQDPYGPEWFERRALESLHRMSASSWDFSDSLLLYTPQGEETYEAVQESDTPYHEMVTKPERTYLEAIADQVAAELPDHFDYIDLGPGTEHKEQYLFDALKRQGKTFRYIPVDISPGFLAASARHAAEQDIPVVPTRSSFETLPARLPESDVPRFVSIGLTYSNYKPQDILELLKDIAGDNGYAFINAQLQERTDTRALEEIYAEFTGMYDSKLKLLGFDPEKDIGERKTNNLVQSWCQVTNVPPKLQELGMEPGDWLLVFQSLRPTKESLEEEVSALFPEHTLFDTGESFVGAVLKHKK